MFNAGASNAAHIERVLQVGMPTDATAAGS